MPIPVYAVRLLGDWAVVAAGLAGVALMFLAARRLTSDNTRATIAAAALFLTPVVGLDPNRVPAAVFVLPFVLTWLLGVLTFLERPSIGFLAVAMASLGVAFFADPAAPLTAILLAIVTLVALWAGGHRDFRTHAVAILAFGGPLLVLIPWFVKHPDTYQDTLGAWLIHKAHIRNPIDGLRANVNWTVVGTRLSVYWELFNPAFLLFGNGGPAPLFWPLVFFIPFGAVRAWKELRPGPRALVFLGLLASPIAAAVFATPHAIDRAAAMLVLLTLLGTWGLVSAVRSLRSLDR